MRKCCGNCELFEKQEYPLGICHLGSKKIVKIIKSPCEEWDANKDLLL